MSTPATTQNTPTNPQPSEHDEVGDRPAAPRVSWLKAVVLGCLTLAALSGLYLTGWIPRTRQAAALARRVAETKAALPRVLIGKPRQAPAVVVALVPGDVQAVEETAIYPRTAGYLHKWHVDIGDDVREGELLAEIDVPEVQKELQQSEASLTLLKAKLATASAALRLAESTKRRNLALPDGAISEQERDEVRARYDTAETQVKTADADIGVGEANLNRMREMLAFAKVYAPFAGTVTARDVDVGQLLSPGNMGQPLFHIAKTNPVRVIVNVPQIFAPGVETGMPAQIVVREIPGRDFVGKVTRTARSIDPTTRTLRTEIEVPNDDGALLVGSYVQVKLDVRRANPPLLIPAAALTFDADGTRVATLDTQNRVRFKAVTLEGDFGSEVGVADGLLADDRIVTNPGDRLSDGVEVTIMQPAAPAAAAPAKTASAK